MTMQKARYAVSSVIVAVFATILSVATADATTLGLQSPEGLVFQGANILWIADYKANTVFKVDVSNLNSPSLICKVSNLNGPTRLAISGANVLVVNTTGQTVQAYNSTNCTPVGNPLTGFNRPLGVAVSGPTTMVIDNGTDEVLYFFWNHPNGKAIAVASGTRCDRHRPERECGDRLRTERTKPAYRIHIGYYFSAAAHSTRGAGL